MKYGHGLYIKTVTVANTRYDYYLLPTIKLPKNAEIQMTNAFINNVHSKHTTSAMHNAHVLCVMIDGYTLSSFRNTPLGRL